MLTDCERQPLDLKLKVADTPFLPKSIPFQQILSSLGKDFTWMELFATERNILRNIPGVGPKTVDQIFRFINENFDIPFEMYVNFLDKTNQP